jgi:formylmethanofuran dehydrogenase subunit E-like metal-binding protein
MRKHFSVYACTMIVVLSLMIPEGMASERLESHIADAMQKLSVTRNDSCLLVVTNATYVTVNGKPALSFLDRVQHQTGCTVGRGNLLFFQRPQDHPLRFVLFHKTSGESVIISRKESDWRSKSLHLGAETILTNAFWDNTDRFDVGNELFTLAAITNSWAKGAPYDFLKAAELHNHLCPGLTSGYLIGRYILNTYPLQEGDRYTILASPVWCKEDALQVLLDCTPGKKSMIVKPLSDKQKKQISVQNPAGIVLIWNPKKQSGKGVVLSFDSERLSRIPPKNTPKAATILYNLQYIDKPEKFVSTAAEFDLNKALMQRLLMAGTNPYEELDLVNKK